jgi:hemerythrin-like metal-binding protein
MGVGVRTLDDEHQALSQCVQELRRAITARANVSQVLEILAITCEKAKSHCTNEEAVLREHGYPQFSVHQEAHRKWLADISALHQSIRSGKMSTQVAPGRLETWFAEHIIHEDKKYAPFLRRCNVR